MKINKNEIKRYLKLLILAGGAFYGGIIYNEGKENRINEKYQILCDNSISDYDALNKYVHDWVMETKSNLMPPSLVYSLLLMFADREKHEEIIHIFYGIMQDKDTVTDRINRIELNTMFYFVFDEAFSKVMKLDVEKRKIFKRENICYVYQKYIIDVTIYNNLVDNKIEKYCDGLVVPKKFTTEEIEENKRIKEELENIRP